MSRRVASSMLGVGDHVADGEAASRARTRAASRKHRRLVAREVDHAVGDDHVDGVVGQRDVLDRSLQELDVVDPGLALVVTGQLEHLVRHVEPVCLARGADAPGGEEHVDAAA